MVVQDDLFNHSRITTVVVFALTTNLRRASWPGNVLLEAGEGGTPQAKRRGRIAGLLGGLRERIGSLSEARVEEILAGLRFQQASFFRG